MTFTDLIKIYEIVIEISEIMIDPSDYNNTN